MNSFGRGGYVTQVHSGSGNMPQPSLHHFAPLQQQQQQSPPPPPNDYDNRLKALIAELEELKKDNAYRKVNDSDTIHTLFGVPKHVFKVREVTKLLLFASAAFAGILLIDLTVRLVLISQKKQQ